MIDWLTDLCRTILVSIHSFNMRIIPKFQQYMLNTLKYQFSYAPRSGQKHDSSEHVHLLASFAWFWSERNEYIVISLHSVIVIVYFNSRNLSIIFWFCEWVSHDVIYLENRCFSLTLFREENQVGGEEHLRERESEISFKRQTESQSNRPAAVTLNATRMVVFLPSD